MTAPVCPNCGSGLRWFAEQNAWGCDRCRQLVQPVWPQQSPAPAMPAPHAAPMQQTAPMQQSAPMQQGAPMQRALPTAQPTASKGRGVYAIAAAVVVIGAIVAVAVVASKGGKKSEAAQGSAAATATAAAGSAEGAANAALAAAGSAVQAAGVAEKAAAGAAANANTAVAAATGFKVGDAVMGQWTDGEWYPGKIGKINDDGTYRVNYNDGDVSPHLTEKQVKARKTGGGGGGGNTTASKSGGGDPNKCPGDGWTRCGGNCYLLTDDPNHCGSCNHSCPSNMSFCKHGQCDCSAVEKDSNGGACPD